MKFTTLVFILICSVLIGTTSVFADSTVGIVVGSGTWVNGSGVTQQAEFNAHESHNGQPATGRLHQINVDGEFIVDIDDVTVAIDGNGVLFACFGGITTVATDNWEPRLGKYRWTVVVDGGSGTNEIGADYFRGVWQDAKPPWCADITNGTYINDAFSRGNVQIILGRP